MTNVIHEEKEAPTRIMTKTEPPKWLLAFSKEIDDKTFGRGFDCLAEDANRFARICVPSSTPA